MSIVAFLIAAFVFGGEATGVDLLAFVQQIQAAFIGG